MNTVHNMFCLYDTKHKYSQYYYTPLVYPFDGYVKVFTEKDNPSNIMCKNEWMTKDGARNHWENMSKLIGIGPGGPSTVLSEAQKLDTCLDIDEVKLGEFLHSCDTGHVVSFKKARRWGHTTIMNFFEIENINGVRDMIFVAYGGQRLRNNMMRIGGGGIKDDDLAYFRGTNQRVAWIDGASNLGQQELYSSIDKIRIYFPNIERIILMG